MDRAILDAMVDMNRVSDSLVADLGTVVPERLRPALAGEADQDYALDWINQVLDEVIEARWAARPVCPRHAHPLEAQWADGWFAWCCPRSGELVALLGQLATSQPQ